MTPRTWDADGDARTALRTVLTDYGEAGLSSYQLMASVLKDLLAEAPREASVLLAAAEVDLAGALRQRTAQGMTPQAAAAQAAALLEDRTGLADEACMWVAQAIAGALGLAPDNAGPAGSSARTDPRLSAADTASVAEGDPRAPAGTRNGAAEPGPQQRQPLRPRPDSPDPGRRPTLVAASGSLVAALLLPLFVAVAPYPQAMPWSVLLVIVGLSVTAAAVFALVPGSRRWGLGAVLGAGTVAAASLAQLASTSAQGSAIRGSMLASELLLVAAAVVAAVSAVAAARALGLGRVRVTQAGAVLCVIGACFALSALAAHDDSFYNGRWNPDYPLFGQGTTGWEYITGVMYLVLLVVPLIVAVGLVGDQVARAGAWAGWLAGSTAWLMVLNLVVLDKALGQVRVTPWIYVSWGLWLAALAAGAVMLTRQRPAAAMAA